MLRAVTTICGPRGDRAAVLSTLFDDIQMVRPGERALIAIDGFDGAGKSWLAAELVGLAVLRGGRPLFSVSIDGFHHPRARRRAAGTGPEGFYRSSYRYDVFHEVVVDRLRAGLPVVPRVWDVVADEPVEAEHVIVPDDGIVIVDGIFLHRPELVDAWDASVWLEVPFSVSVPRGNARFPGTHDPEPDAAENIRYVGGQRLYVAEVDPAGSATWVIDNTDLENPCRVAIELS